MADLLTLSGVSAGYGRIEALSDVSLSVEEGAITALLGANGAGKTTVLNTICGLVAARRGEITFDGRRMDGLASERIVTLGISQVPEGREVFRDMSVHENLLLGAHQRRDTAGITRDIEVMCGHFPILRQRWRQMAGTLSGGEQQMLLIARALMARPRLLLLDEPSLGLSPLLVQRVFETIVRLHLEEKLTLLVVEQNAAIALEVAHHAYILENGEIAAHGTPAELSANDAVASAYLGM